MMAGLTLQELAVASDAALQGVNAEVSGVAIDSRAVSSGDVFVALRGERVDGHDYLVDARANGAVGAVVERDVDAVNADALAQIVVGDSVQALAAIARCNRARFAGPLVAITGSAGKTSCKNMLASILGQSAEVTVTEGNLNNELGVPLTVARIDDRTEVAVIEMGAAQRGDIAYLCDIASPTVAILTNVAEAHIGRFGDLLTTAQTKGEIYQALSEGGVAVLNADDDYASLWRESIASRTETIRVVDFSLTDPAASVYVSAIESSVSGTGFRVQVALDECREEFAVELPLLGTHNVANALAAIAAALVLGSSPQAAIAGLAQVRPANGRLQLRRADAGMLLIDDSYNANPQAIVAAAEVLCEIAAHENCHSVAVLGDMGELGDRSAQLHRDTGRALAEKGVQQLLLVGEFARDYAAGFDAQSGQHQHARVFESQHALLQELDDDVYANAVLLVKGSRTAAMERVSDALCAGNRVSEEQNPC